jgi:hypothetical protein
VHIYICMYIILHITAKCVKISELNELQLNVVKQFVTLFVISVQHYMSSVSEASESVSSLFNIAVKCNDSDDNVKKNSMLFIPCIFLHSIY